MRARWISCWGCGGYGQSGRFTRYGDVVVHLSIDCPTCRGRGAKRFETVKR